MPKVKPSEVIAAIQKEESEVLDLSDGGLDCFGDAGDHSFSDLFEAIRLDKKIETIDLSGNTCLSIKDMGVIRLDGILNAIARKTNPIALNLSKCGIRAEAKDIFSTDKDKTFDAEIRFDLRDNADINLQVLKTFLAKFPKSVMVLDAKQFDLVRDGFLFQCKKMPDDSFEVKRTNVKSNRSDSAPVVLAKKEASKKDNRQSVFLPGLTAAAETDEAPDADFSDLKALVADINFPPSPQ